MQAANGHRGGAAACGGRAGRGSAGGAEPPVPPPHPHPHALPTGTDRGNLPHSPAGPCSGLLITLHHPRLAAPASPLVTDGSHRVVEPLLNRARTGSGRPGRSAATAPPVRYCLRASTTSARARSPSCEDAGAGAPSWLVMGGWGRGLVKNVLAVHVRLVFSRLPVRGF